MRISPLICLLLLSIFAFAEGTRELAPNASIMIGANNTTDIASLHLGHNAYNNFAVYNNPDPNSRLYIHIADPENECMLLGFTFGHLNQTTQNPTRQDFEYRVRDPNGNIVFGPVPVPTTGGNIQNWSEAHTGPMQIYGAGGYDATQVSSAQLTSQGWSGAGDYFIEFDFANVGAGLLIDFWDITVADCSQSALEEKKGRVWSFNWAIFAINDFQFPERPFNGAYYVCAPDPDNPDAAFITKIDFNGAGFRPAAFNVAFNSFGSMNTGNVMSDRRSVEGLNSTQSEYAVFLNDPVDLCITAEPGDVELLGVSRCDAESFCIKYIASKEGQIDLLLDFDGPDDVYTPGTADVMLVIDVPANEVGKPSCVFWDGLDGLGNALDENAGTAIPVVISYAQGIYHFPIYDAEFMTNGFIIESVRPVGPQPLLYYDDSQISIASGSGEPAVQLSGCMPPCHRWTVFNNPDVPGFGNLNTINSWWFSQRIVRAEVFFLPAYLQCSIVGPESLCEGETTTLTWEPGVSPEGSDVPEITSVIWSGPDIIGSNEGSVITIGNGGMYSATVTWLTQLGDTCTTTCEQSIVEKPITYGEFDTLIISGEVIEINGEQFSEAGQFLQTLTGSNGCDSILTIRISVIQTAVHFTLDECNSFPSIGTDSIYTEFTPEYPEPISCAEVEASIAYRENPGVNRHSCTPGVEDSPAICISSLDACEFADANEKAFVFEITVTPAPDTIVALTGLSFYERAPEMYDWISGPSGPNNYPTLYGVRVLKDGTEIYRDVDIAATIDWTLEEFDFLGLEEFIVAEQAVFRFELLGYCLIGNGEPVAAWDIDEIRVQASCGLEPPEKGDISGSVFADNGKSVPNVEILLSTEPDFIDPIIAMSDEEGVFMFPGNLAGQSYYLRAQKHTDYLENVSTLDLVALQKHLLGLQEFTSPLQYLAADANGNQSISVIDLVDLRKLVLGQYTELPDNASWLLGKPDQELTLTDPWSFERTMVVQDLTTELAQVDFFGIKIGDIHRSLTGNAGSVQTRALEALRLVIGARDVQAGEPVQIDFHAGDVVDLAGFQMALKLNNVRFTGVANGVLEMDGCFAYDPISATLKVSWSSGLTRALTSGQLLFSLILEPLKDVSSSEMFALNAEALTCEAYVGHETETVPITLDFTRSGSTLATGLALTAYPNPFANETTVQFYLAEAGIVQLNVMDVTGRTLVETEHAFEAGLQSIQVSTAELNRAGHVFFCQLQANGLLETVRLVVLE